MATLSAPAALGDFDLGVWLAANAAPGDTIELPAGHTFTTFNPTAYKGWADLTIKGNGATIVVPDFPLAGVNRRPFELIDCTNVRVFDLTVKGNRPLGYGYVAEREGQHGFTVRGGERNVLCGCTARDLWGDGVHLSRWDAPARDTIVCRQTIVQVSRHGYTATAAEGVLIVGGKLDAVNRTMFNLEVHPGQAVRHYEASGIEVGWNRLSTITATGEGAATDVTFKGLAIHPKKSVAIVVSGPTPQADDRDYGARSGWRMEDIAGGIVTVKPHLPPPIRLEYIDGLTVDGLAYPDAAISTKGSTLTA